MNTPQLDLVESRLKQLHEYIRHISQQTVSWFTFFVTVNYAVMGWVLVSSFAAKPVLDVQSRSGRVIFLVSIVFAFQNILGILACIVVRSHLLERGALVQQLEALFPKAETEVQSTPCFQTVPMRLYSRSVSLMIIALIPLLFAWCLLPFLCR
jgi:hypothetical protein